MPRVISLSVLWKMEYSNSAFSLDTQFYFSGCIMFVLCQRRFCILKFIQFGGSTSRKGIKVKNKVGIYLA